MTLPRLRYIDIGLNLSDAQFDGMYHGRQAHPQDRPAVIRRAHFEGVQKMIVTSSYLDEARQVVEMCTQQQQQEKGTMYATVGVHPCHAKDVGKDGSDKDTYYAQLRELLQKGKDAGVVKAMGEIGLDYDRLHYAPRETQLEVFKDQLQLAAEMDLPLFLHSRAADDDFGALLFPYLDSGRLPRGGVVHSFTGTLSEMQTLVERGLYIGVNGCSLKTEENLAVIKEIPLSRLMLETDGPWCEIRPSHASFRLHLAKEYTTAEGKVPKKPSELLPYAVVKKEKFSEGTMVAGRCEPCSIGLVAAVVASVKGITVNEVAEAAWQNTVHVFQLE